MTELPGGSTKTSTTRYFADGSSSVSVREEFPSSAAPRVAMPGSRYGTTAGAIGGAPRLEGSTTASNYPGPGRVGRPVSDRSPYEVEFSNENPSTISAVAKGNEGPWVSSSDDRMASYRDGALMTVQNSDDDDDDDDEDWSTEPQSTTDEAVSRVAGEGRWRSKMSTLATSGYDADERTEPQEEHGAGKVGAAEGPEDAFGTEGLDAKEATATRVHSFLPEMGTEAPDLPPSSHQDLSTDDDPRLSKKSAAYQRAPSRTYSVSSDARQDSAAAKASTRIVASASLTGTTVASPSDESTYVAAEVGDGSGDGGPRPAPSNNAAALSDSRQPLELPMYRSAAQPGTGGAAALRSQAGGGGSAVDTGAVPGFAAAVTATVHRTSDGAGGEELSVKTDGALEVPIAAEVAKDDFRSHLLSHRKTQIGCAVLALVIVGLAVGLGVALGVQPSSPSAEGEAEEEDPDINFWQAPFPNIDGEHNEGDFGATVSMNYDGTRVAIGSPGVWNEIDGEVGVFKRGAVEVRELRNGVWVRLGEEIELSALDRSAHFRSPNAGVRNLLQVVLSGDGDTVAVGMSFHDDANKTNAGAVEIFRWTSKDWIRLGDPIVGSESEDFMGASVSLSDDGGFLAVGAPGNGDNAGCVAVFFFNSGMWHRLGRDGITCAMSGEYPGQMLGGSVSLSADGKCFAVGLSVPNGGGSAKVTRVFKFVGGDWRELGSGIDHGQRIYDTAFSAVLSKDGSRVVISNHYIGENGPAVQSNKNNTDLFVGAFEYNNDINDWEPMGVNLHMNSSGVKSGYFISLSSDGSMIGMGDPGRSVNGGKVAGHAHIYIYDSESGDYRQVGPNIDGEAAGDMFGYEVSLSGNGRHYAIGAPSSRGNGFVHGRVQIYEVPVAV